MPDGLARVKPSTSFDADAEAGSSVGKPRRASSDGGVWTRGRPAGELSFPVTDVPNADQFATLISWTASSSSTQWTYGAASP